MYLIHLCFITSETDTFMGYPFSPWIQGKLFYTKIISQRLNSEAVFITQYKVNKNFILIFILSGGGTSIFHHPQVNVQQIKWI